MIGKIKRPEELGQSEKEQMFRLFSTYYNDVFFNVFCQDLAGKKHVLFVVQGNRIIGFTTIKEIFIELPSGKRAKGLFSGDTVIAKPYWGKTPLRKMFVKYIWLYKVKNPLRPVYWLLISKGYKTYLILAHNFKNFYPRYDRKTPVHYKDIIDSYAMQLYPSDYDSQAGVIYGTQGKDRLKAGVTPLNDTLLKTNKHIAHFQKLNPNWFEGDELVCVGEIRLFQVFSFFTKVFSRGKFFQTRQKLYKLQA